MSQAVDFYHIDFISLNSKTHSTFCTTEHNRSRQVPQSSRKRRTVLRHGSGLRACRNSSDAAPRLGAPAVEISTWPLTCIWTIFGLILRGHEISSIRLSKTLRESGESSVRHIQRICATFYFGDQYPKSGYHRAILRHTIGILSSLSALSVSPSKSCKTVSGGKN